MKNRVAFLFMEALMNVLRVHSSYSPKSKL